MRIYVSKWQASGQGMMVVVTRNETQATKYVISERKILMKYENKIKIQLKIIQYF